MLFTPIIPSVFLLRWVALRFVGIVGGLREPHRESGGAFGGVLRVALCLVRLISGFLFLFWAFCGGIGRVGWFVRLSAGLVVILHHLADGVGQIGIGIFSVQKSKGIDGLHEDSKRFGNLLACGFRFPYLYGALLLGTAVMVLFQSGVCIF